MKDCYLSCIYPSLYYWSENSIFIGMCEPMYLNFVVAIEICMLPLYLQEKEEKLDSDASLNKFFQDIYQDYDDDVRRAMAKSFVRTTYSCFRTILRYQPQLDLFLLQPCFFIRLYLRPSETCLSMLPF